MLEEFRHFVNQNNLFNRDHKILLAVSGGIDSVVMAHLFGRLRLNFGIAHCNFQLRGEASGGDQQFVERLAQQLGCPFHTIRFDTHHYAEEHGQSTQMAARELRYTWFEQIRQQHCYDLIATAHHADDDAETFFINLMRGTGIRGLQAIPLRQGTIVRPLKFARRNTILNWARENGITWRDDATNAETHYLRNKIRHQLLPLIEEINPGFADRLAITIARMNETTAVVDSVVGQQRSKIVLAGDNETRIPVEDLKQLSPIGFWLFELLHPYGFNPASLADLERSLRDPSGQRFYSSSHEAILRSDFLTISPLQQPREQEEYLIGSPADPGALPLRMEWSITEPGMLPKNPSGSEESWFDAAELTFPLTLRRWQQGDRFFPFGMKGSKKISDYFTDHKFTQRQKEETWLLCSGGRIAWIVGHRTDNRFRVTGRTRRVVIIKIIKNPEKQ